MNKQKRIYFYKSKNTYIYVDIKLRKPQLHSYINTTYIVNLN